MTIFNGAAQDEQSLPLYTKVNWNVRRRVLDQAIKNGQTANAVSVFWVIAGVCT